MRELTRAREAARVDLTRKRQQVSSMLLRLGRHYPGIKTWNARHRSWLGNLRLDYPDAKTPAIQQDQVRHPASATH